MTPIKIAVGYVRCSTDMQAETSPEQQKELILDWAKKNSFEVVDWFLDIGKSGTSFEKRPEFVRLKARVESNPDFRTVIVLDESRWGRAGANDSIYYKTLFKKAGNVDVVIMRTMANTGNPTFDTMLGAFEGGLSHEESKKKSERTYDGCLSAIRQGHSSGGTAPYGYRRVAINRFSGTKRLLGNVCGKDGEPMLNEKGLAISEQIRPKEEYVVWEPGEQHEVEIVKRIFELRTNVRYGYMKIAKVLNADHVPCPRRGKWMNKDQKWSSATVGAIIKNPTYMGARVYNRLRKRGIGKFAPRYWVKSQSEWTIIEDSHSSIVSPEQWKAANPSAMHSENGRRAITRFDSPYLLSGLITCPQCNFNFSGKAQTIGPPGNRQKRRTYTDSGYVNKGPTVCTSFSIDAHKLETALMSKIEQRLSTSSVKDRLERMIDEYLASKASTPQDEIDRARTDLLRLNHQISALITLAEKGIKLEEIAERIKQMESERSLVEHRVTHLAGPRPAREEIAKALDEPMPSLNGSRRFVMRGQSVSVRASFVKL